VCVSVCMYIKHLNLVHDISNSSRLHLQIMGFDKIVIKCLRSLVCGHKCGPC